MVFGTPWWHQFMLFFTKKGLRSNFHLLSLWTNQQESPTFPSLFLLSFFNCKLIRSFFLTRTTTPGAEPILRERIVASLPQNMDHSRSVWGPSETIPLLSGRAGVEQWTMKNNKITLLALHAFMKRIKWRLRWRRPWFSGFIHLRKRFLIRLWNKLIRVR